MNSNINFLLSDQGVAFGLHYILIDDVVISDSFCMETGKIHELDLSKKIGDGKLVYVCYTPISDGPNRAVTK